MTLQKYWSNNKKDNNSATTFTIVLLVVYLVALVWILLFKLGVRFSYMENREVNLLPFREPLFVNGKLDFPEIIMNVVVFVPLGIYAGILFKRWSFGKHLCFFFSTSLMIEGLQYSLRIGAFDITDTITNTSGGIIGLMMFKAIEKVFSNSVKAQKLINIIAATGTVLMIVFLVLLRTGNLWLKYQ